MDDLGRLRWSVLTLLIALAATSGGWALARTRDLEGAALGLATDLVGAVVTYALFELIIERRERRETEKQEVEAKKAELIAQMGSGVRDVAVAAAEELGTLGWLEDGSLQGVELWNANLEGANLVGAHMEGADLWEANLQRAILVRAELQRAILTSANLGRASLALANLRGAMLFEADLQEADLSRAWLLDARLRNASLRAADLTVARLQGADLMGARLQGTDMRGARLEGAKVTAKQLARAESLAGATLPDGTKLSEDDWEAEFEEWRKKQEEQN